MEQRAIELIAGKAAWTGLIDSSGARPRPNYNAVQGGDTRAEYDSRDGYLYFTVGYDT